MNMTLRIDPSLRRAVLAPTSVFAMGDEVSDLVLEFPHAAPDPDGLSLSLRRGGPSGDVVAIATEFSAVGSHRRLLSASVSLKTTVLDAWRLEVKAAADAAAESTAANPKKAPSPLQTAWLDVSSPSEVYASCPVPILLRETSDLTELLAGAVRYDKPQSLADREKATARANIGAGEPYDPAPLAARVEALEAKSEQDPSFGAWKSGSSVALGAGAVAQGDGTLALHASGLDKVYLNAASAPRKLSDAVASAADAVVSSKGYATVQAATSLASSAAGAALETAKAHSDANLETAKAHSDANLDTAKAHSDANLGTAKSYADTKASGALGDAKSYADSKAAAVEAKIPSKVSALENDSKFITSSQVSPGDAPGNAAQADHAYTAGRADEAYAVPWSGVTGKPTTLSGYGITDAATKSELDSVSSTASLAVAAAVDAHTALASKADLVDGKVPAAQLPSFVDDVLEYDAMSAFPATGETGKIYVAKDTNLAYRWGGTQYVEISPSLALGETATMAYPGDKGKATADLAAEAKAAADAASTAAGSAYDSLYQHRDNKSNPHGVTAEQVGALPLTGGTLTGDLAVGEEHTASRKITVSAESGSNGITLQGGTSAGSGSSVSVGGSSGNGGGISIQGGGISGGRLYVGGLTGAGGGAIEVDGVGASIKKDGKEVATEAFVDGKLSEVDGKLSDVSYSISMLTGAVTSKADKTALEEHVADTNNPHGVTAEQVGALPLSGGTVTGNLTLDVFGSGSSPTLKVFGVSSSGIKLNAEYGGKITVGDGSNGGGQVVLEDSSVPGGVEAEVTIGTVKVRATLAAKQDKLTKDSDPTVGALLLMGDRVSNGVSIDATPGGEYGALAVKGADNRTSVLTPDGSPALTQTLGDARYASADALASLAPESIKKTVDGAKWALSADLVSTKTTTVAGEASCSLTTQFGSASLSKVQDRLFSGTLDGIGNVAVWWDDSVWNWGVHPNPSDPTSMQSVSTDPSSDANATSLSFSDGSTATVSLGAGTEVVETSHLATVESVAAAYVPVTRTVNGKPLSTDVALTAADVGAVGSETDPLFKAWKDATNVVIGAGASTVATASPFVNNSVAIGPGAKTVPFTDTNGKYKESAAVAIGHGAEAHGYGVAIGKGAVSTGGDVVLGSEQTTGLIVFADPNSFVFRTPEEGTYVSKPLQSFLDKYWKKTEWLAGVPRVDIVPEGCIKCPDYMGTDGVSVCFSADGNDIDDTTSRLYPDGSNVVTEKTVRSVIDTQPATVNSGRLYSFRPSASSGSIAIVPAFEAGLKGAAEAFLDFSAAAPAVSFGGTGVTVLYADGSLKPSDLAVSNRYMMELKWFSTAASGTAQRYMIVNIYKVSEAVS